MIRCDRIACVLLLASLARGQASGALAAGDLGRAAAAPIQAPDGFAPFGLDEERFAQLLREAPEDDSSISVESGAIPTILLGLALLFAAGPLGRLVSGLDTPSRPRRADDPGPQA